MRLLNKLIFYTCIVLGWITLYSMVSTSMDVLRLLFNASTDSLLNVQHLLTSVALIVIYFIIGFILINVAKKVDKELRKED